MDVLQEILNKAPVVSSEKVNMDSQPSQAQQVPQSARVVSTKEDLTATKPVHAAERGPSSIHKQPLAKLPLNVVTKEQPKPSVQAAA